MVEIDGPGNYCYYVINSSHILLKGFPVKQKLLILIFFSLVGLHSMQISSMDIEKTSPGTPERGSVDALALPEHLRLAQERQALAFEKTRHLLAIHPQGTLTATQFFSLLPKDIWHLIMNYLSPHEDATLYMAQYASITKEVAQKLAPSMLMRCGRDCDDIPTWLVSIEDVPLFKRCKPSHRLLIQTLTEIATKELVSHSRVIKLNKKWLSPRGRLLYKEIKKYFDIFLDDPTSSSPKEVLGKFTLQEIKEVERYLSLSSHMNIRCLKLTELKFANMRNIAIAGPLLFLSCNLFSLVKFFSEPGFMNTGSIIWLMQGCLLLGLAAYIAEAAANPADFVKHKVLAATADFIHRGILTRLRIERISLQQRRISNLHCIVKQYLDSLNAANL